MARQAAPRSPITPRTGSPTCLLEHSQATTCSEIGFDIINRNAKAELELTWRRNEHRLLGRSNMSMTMKRNMGWK